MEQQNNYVKQFPDLMKGKKILYVHGFASSGQSGTVARLRTVFPHATVIAPDLPLHPAEAMQMLRSICDREHPDLILGTSMGGMYTEKLYGYDRVCMNPAMQMGDTMVQHGMMGAQHFQNPRQDGVQDFIVTKALVKEYREMTEHNFEGVDDEERRRVYGMFGDADTVVDTFGMFSEHYPQSMHFHGEHRMNDQSFMHAVVPVIRWIDDRQTQRERPIVYIGVEALQDAWLKPVSSCQKAVRMLIERYQVYFVAAAPTDVTGPEHTGAVQAWLAQYIGTPAWGHTVYTNQRHLLMGDYLIARPKGGDTPSAFYTRIELGSSTFKTWDDIIDFYERLDGQ